MDKLDKALLQIFLNAQTQLLGNVMSALEKWNTQKASILYQKIQGISATLIKQYGERARVQLPLQYLLWVQVVEKALQRNELLKEIEKLDSIEFSKRAVAQKELIQWSLWVIHYEAVQSLVEESVGKVNNAIAWIERNIRYSLWEIQRVEIQQTLAQWLITGETLDKSKDKILDIFRTQWVTAFTDKAGKRWGITRYAQMLVRTETIRAYNLWTLNQWVANGIKRYRNLESVDCCPICQPYRNKILTIGKDRFPPHHPNCGGTLSPIVG